MTPAPGRAGRTPTERGDRRRAAIVAAAAALLERDGFDGVSHRAVAREAGVPLASTTYYFGSREELLAEALARLGERFLAHARALAAQPATGDRAALAGRIVAMVAGPPGPDARARLLTFYERYVQAGRSPALAQAARELTRRHVDLVARVLATAGAPDPARTARHAVALVDGLLLAALATGADDPAAGLAGELTTWLGP